MSDIRKGKITELTPDKRNANRGTKRGLAALDHSIRQYGVGRGIVVDKNGVIIGGNKTVERLADLGIDDVVIVPTDGKTLVVTQRTDLDLETDKAARELGYADNRVGQLDLEWEPQEITLDLANGIELGELFTDKELQELGVQQEEPKADPGPQIDKAEELREKWGVQPGQLWQLGEHRLICGDCTDRAVIERLMGDDRAEMVWTDPPYGVSVGEKNKFLNSIAPSNRIEENLENDTLAEPELTAMLCTAFDNAISVCTAGAAWHVAAPAVPLHVLFGQALKDRGIWRQTIQWVKNNATFAPLGVCYHWRAEPIFFGWLPNGAHRYYGDRKQDTVWEIDRPTKSPEHPTMKPVELVTRAIENHTLRGEIVLDLFVGSGTTMCACEATGRVCRASEISPAYCAVTIQRWVDMTGGTPILLD